MPVFPGEMHQIFTSGAQKKKLKNTSASRCEVLVLCYCALDTCMAGTKRASCISSAQSTSLGNVTKIIYLNLRDRQLAPWDNLLAILVNGECLCFIRFLPWQKKESQTGQNRTGCFGMF